MRNKNNIRKNTPGYGEWLDGKEGYDPVSLENLSSAASPYAIRALAPPLEDMYERLEVLYYDGRLKGRQKQIVTAMLNGTTTQVAIAKQLNMKQSNVAAELRKIMKKISKNII